MRRISGVEAERVVGGRYLKRHENCEFQNRRLWKEKFQNETTF